MRHLGQWLAGMAIVGLTTLALAAAGCGSSSAAEQAAAKSAAQLATTTFTQQHPGARAIAARYYRPTATWIVQYRNPDGSVGYAAYDAKGRPTLMPAPVAAALKK